MVKLAKTFERLSFIPFSFPDEFASYEEAGEFWDTHDTTDYHEAFVDVDFDVKLQGRRFEIDIDEEHMENTERKK